MVYFPLTIDSDLSLTAQSVLRRECGDHICAITLEYRPDRHEVRLWITLAAAAYVLAVHVLIAEVPAAEFGSVRPSKYESASAPGHLR